MPKRIPISALKALAQAQGLRQAILLAWDGELTHVVTYGESVEDCDQAAQGGDKAKEYLGWADTPIVYPSRVQALMDRIKVLEARNEELEDWYHEAEQIGMERDTLT